MVVYLKMFLGNVLETLTNRFLVSLASVFLLPPRKGAGLCSRQDRRAPHAYTSLPPAKSQGIMALPGDWARSIGSESLGGANPTSSILGDGESEQTFPSQAPQGGSLPARLAPSRREQGVRLHS